MRRLLRWTFNTLAAASLLLCLATAGLWVRSYWVADGFSAERPDASKNRREYISPHYRCLIASFDGHLGGWFFWTGRPQGRPTSSWEFELGHPGKYSPEPGTGFSLRRDGGVHGGYAYNTLYWRLPDWSLVSAFAVLPAIFAFRQIRAVRRRRHRSRLGLCPACGYDLRASPGRCPECGRERMTR